MSSTARPVATFSRSASASWSSVMCPARTSSAWSGRVAISSCESSRRFAAPPASGAGAAGVTGGSTGNVLMGPLRRYRPFVAPLRSPFRGTARAQKRPIRQVMSSEPTPWLPLGELLVERRLLSRRQLELALQEHQRTGRRLGEVLVSYGFVSEQALASTLLEQVGLMDAKPPSLPSRSRSPSRCFALRPPRRGQPHDAVVLRVEDMLAAPGLGTRRLRARGEGRRVRAAQRPDSGQHRRDPRRARRATELGLGRGFGQRQRLLFAGRAVVRHRTRPPASRPARRSSPAPGRCRPRRSARP